MMAMENVIKLALSFIYRCDFNAFYVLFFSQYISVASRFSTIFQQRQKTEQPNKGMHSFRTINKHAKSVFMLHVRCVSELLLLLLFFFQLKMQKLLFVLQRITFSFDAKKKIQTKNWNSRTKSYFSQFSIFKRRKNKQTEECFIKN